MYSALLECNASYSAPVTVSNNWGKQSSVKSCKNEPNATISILIFGVQIFVCLLPEDMDECLHTKPQACVPPLSCLLFVHIRRRWCGCLRGHGCDMVEGLQLWGVHLKEVIWASCHTITEKDSVLWHGWWKKIVVMGPVFNVLERSNDVTSSILSALTLQRSQLGTGTQCSHRLPCSQRWWSWYTPDLHQN